MASWSSDYPPMLLRSPAIAVSRLEEALLSTAEPQKQANEVSVGDALVQLANTKQLLETEAGYNKYIFVQYVMCLYIRIFMTEDTNVVYRELLRNTAVMLDTAAKGRGITDRSLMNLLRAFPVTADYRDIAGPDFISALKATAARIVPWAAYPGVTDLLAVICVVYSTRSAACDKVTLYRAILTTVDGYEAPAISLVSTGRMVSLSTQGQPVVADLLWKFIGSLNIPGSIEYPGDLSRAFTRLAELALPMDPTILTTNMRCNFFDNAKTGVPFLNYLAMYVRQSALGIDYSLSRLADTRRYVMQQLHRFCGIGATCIRDTVYATALLAAINQVRDQAQEQVFSPDDEALYRHLRTAIEVKSPRFLTELRYGDATETAKAKDDGAFADDKQIDDTTPDKPADDDPDDDTQSDSDPTKPKNTTEASQTGDDNIGQTGDSSQTVLPQTTSKFLPLALPSETIDDLLYRLAVLRFVSDLDGATDAEVSAETLSMLKVWCGSLLFIASAAATRTLMSQLKLTGKLKEISE